MKTPLKLKIHKRGIPETSVITSVNCLTSKISDYVDYHLQVILKEILSLVKDTNDFLKITKQIKIRPKCLHRSVCLNNIIIC